MKSSRMLKCLRVPAGEVGSCGFSSVSISRSKDSDFYEANLTTAPCTSLADTATNTGFTYSALSCAAHKISIISIEFSACYSHFV